MAAVLLLLRRIPRIPTSFSRTYAATATATATATPHSAIKSAIWAESSPEKIAEAFETAAQQQPTVHGDRQLYKIAVQKLARARRPDLVDRILQRQLSPDSAASKSEGFLIRIIGLYSTAGMADHAARTFDHMASIGCPRSERAFCALLTAFLDNHQLDRLHEAHAKIPAELGITPGIVSHNILIKARCVGDDLAGARKLLDEMPGRGVKPDIVSYTTLLNAYLKKGDNAGFEEVLNEIYTKGLNPNAATFNCRIRWLCGKGKSSEAEELLDVMTSKKVYPGRVTFNLLIAGFCKEGRVDSAMRVLERMQTIKTEDGNEGIQPNFETYTTLLGGLVEKGEFGPAAEICNKCLAKKWAPPFQTVKGLLSGLASNSKKEEAQGIAKKMKRALSGDAVAAWDKYVSTCCL